MFDAKCTVFVPEGNSPDKNTTVEALGGEVIIRGTILMLPGTLLSGTPGKSVPYPYILQNGRSW